MNNLPRDLVLLHEEIPDDEELIEELIALVDRASPIGLSRSPPEKPRKNVKKIVSGIIFYGLLISLIVGAFFLSRGEKKPILGYSFMNVLTWSMEPEIPQGSLVIIKETDPAAIQIGDDITYTIDPQTSVTHRVIGIMEDYENSGARGFETQGIDNDTPDFEIVPAINVVGVVKFHVPVLGDWLDWLGNNLWLVLAFAVGIMLFIFLLKGALKKPQKPSNTTVYTNSQGEVRVNKTTHSERESNHMKGKFRRIFYGAGAAVMATALAVGGTFAYTYFGHKSNFITTDIHYQARLVEDFDTAQEWTVNEPITKKVSVKNAGNPNHSKFKKWGDIYARIQLREHLDITPVNYKYYQNDEERNVYFMIDKSGEFVRFVPQNAQKTLSKAQLELIKSDPQWSNVIKDADELAAFLSGLSGSNFVRVQGYYDTQEYWYLVTKEGDPNGQYGAPLAMERIVDPALRDSPTNTTRATEINYSDYDPLDHKTDECSYALHSWDYSDPIDCGLATHDYVDWVLGDSTLPGDSFIPFDEWNGKPIDKWILTDDGWATWGNAIKPGESTDLLLEKIIPIAQPEGELFYVIHVDMEACDLKEMPDDWIIYGIFEDDAFTFGAPRRLHYNTSDLPPIYIHPDTEAAKAAGTVTWRTGPDPSPVASVNEHGVVTLLGGAGSVKIIATITPPDGGKPYEEFYTIVVTDDSEPITPPADAYPRLSFPAKVPAVAGDAPFDAIALIQGEFTAAKYALSDWDSSTDEATAVAGMVSPLAAGNPIISVLVSPKDGVTAPYTISFELEISDDKLPTKDFDPWPTNTDDNLYALGSVIQEKETLGVGMHFNGAPTNPHNGYGYFPLEYFLSDDLIKNGVIEGRDYGAPIEVVLVSAGVMHDSDGDGDDELVGAVAADNVKVNYTPGLYFERRSGMLLDYRTTPCIVVSHLFDKPEIKSIPYSTSDSYYISKMTIQFKKGERLSDPITLPLMYEASLLATQPDP